MVSRFGLGSLARHVCRQQISASFYTGTASAFSPGNAQIGSEAWRGHGRAFSHLGPSHRRQSWQRRRNASHAEGHCLRRESEVPVP